MQSILRCVQRAQGGLICVAPVSLPQHRSCHCRWPHIRRRRPFGPPPPCRQHGCPPHGWSLPGGPPSGCQCFRRVPAPGTAGARARWLACYDAASAAPGQLCKDQALCLTAPNPPTTQTCRRTLAGPVPRPGVRAEVWFLPLRPACLNSAASENCCWTPAGAATGNSAGSCSDSRTDNANCGVCGRVCGSNAQCVGGSCVCIPSEWLSKQVGRGRGAGGA